MAAGRGGGCAGDHQSLQGRCPLLGRHRSCHPTPDSTAMRAGGHRDARQRPHQAQLSHPLERVVGIFSAENSCTRSTPLSPAHLSLPARWTSLVRWPAQQHGVSWHPVPDVVHQMLVALLGEDHAEGVGQALHLPLCCVLLQDGENLLLDLWLVTKDVIHLRGRREKGH